MNKSISALFVPVIFCILLSGCLDGTAKVASVPTTSSSPAPASNNAIPFVTSISPILNANNVPTNTVITALFSTTMNPSTITSSTFTVSNGVTGTVSYSGSTASFTPSSSLASNTTYTVTITTGVQSTNGQALASNYTWSFTTTGVPVAPVISSVTPGNLSTNISVNAVVSAVFSEAMNSSTLTSSTFTLNNGATGTVSYNGTTATFIPSVSLAYSTTYTATISTGVQSASGLALGSPYSWSFTTAPSTPANHMGINIDAPADYSENRTFADAIKSSRAFIKGSSLSSTVDASVDSLGWPQEDFCFYVWAGIGNMYGLHTLTFNGQATVVSNLGAVTISYDAPSNTSTGTINISVAQDGNKMLSLTFSNTKRTSTSAVGSGVTNIQLMRPTSLGAATSYPSTTLFNTRRILG